MGSKKSKFNECKTVKTATTNLINLLKTNTFLMADLYTFTLRNGTTYRFTNFETDLIWNSNTYLKNGLLIKRNGVKVNTGIQVDSLNITINSQDYIMNGTNFFKLIANGGLDGASLELSRLFFTDPLSPVGSMWVFSGRVSDSSVTRFEAILQINSDIELLNIQMPRNLYQPSCVHSVYNSGCTAVKNYVNSTVNNGSTARTINATLAQANGWFNEGIIEFTSGSNNGVTRTIKSHATNVLTLALALPNTPQVGDTFRLLAGCGRNMTTCKDKFNNLANYRGYPFIPSQDSIR